jgi:hypothetical protein
MSVPMYRNPAYRSGLVALVTWLLENHYSAHAIHYIEDFVAVHGTLAGSMIDPEDEAVAEEEFVSALPAVAGDSEAWDDPSVFLDIELLAAGRHPLPFGPEPEGDVRDFAAAALEDLPLPSISGGAPEPEPFEPSPADWNDYRAHFDRVDRPGPPADQAEPARTDRYSVESLERIHRALYGRSEPFHA